MIEKDIRKALANYPTLKMNTKNGSIRVTGEIPLLHSDVGEYDRYSVLIRITKEYPYAFPRVIETSGKIPRIANRHVNKDLSLCLAVHPEEKLICRNGISFEFFLNKVLIPHLSRETYRTLEGNYPDGEYSHGLEGVWEYFFKFFDSIDKGVIVRELDGFLSKEALGRNDECYCGSKLKFKKCHDRIWSELSFFGHDYIDNINELFRKELNERN